MTGVPLLSLQGALDFKPGADPLHNEALVQMWVEVKIKPLLKSITKRFLSCLSTKNFTCSTYQTVCVSFRLCPHVCRGDHMQLLTLLSFLPQGEGAQSALFWDGSSQAKVDLHILYVPLPVWRQGSW